MLLDLNSWYQYEVIIFKVIQIQILLFINYKEKGGFPDGSEGKVSACCAGDPGLIPGSGRSPAEGNGKPLQYSCLEESHGWRNLVGYRPWGRKESGMTERVHR